MEMRGFMALIESMRGSSQSIRVPVRTPGTFSTTWRPFGLKVVLGTLGAQLERLMTTSECQRSVFASVTENRSIIASSACTAVGEFDPGKIEAQVTPNSHQTLLTV